MPNTARKTPIRSTDDKRAKQQNKRAPQVDAPQSQTGELSRAVENPEIATPANLLSLQRRYGNRAVQRLTQPKAAPAAAAEIGTYEQEAEPVGEEVLAAAPVASQPRPFDDDEGQPKSTGVVQRLPRLRSERVQRAPTTTTESTVELPTTTTEGAPQATTTTPTAETTNTTATGETTTGETTNTTTTGEATNADTTDTTTTGDTTNPTTTTATTNTPPTNTAPQTPESLPVDSTPQSWLQMQSLAHETKIRPVLKSYMESQNFGRNYDFYFDTSDSQSLYKKYIKEGAPKQINVQGGTRSNLDEMARAKQWRAMGRPIEAARAENQEIINTQVLPGFEQSPGFQKFTDLRRPEKGGGGGLGAAISGLQENVSNMRQMAARPAFARQQQVTKATMARLEKHIVDYTGYLNSGKKTVTDLGLPSDPKVVEKMFQGGRMRHRKVVAIFTQRVSRDKFFRKKLYPAFFTKLENFTKLWAEYRKLLAR